MDIYLAMASSLPTSTAQLQHQKIFQAIRDNDLAKVLSLLNSCSNQFRNIVDITNKDNTLLHCAVEEDRYEIVQELLLKKWKLDINAKNLFYGDTALHICAKNNSLRLILLLTKGTISDLPKTRKISQVVGNSNQPGPSREITSKT